ncbi:uncharacterized protein LOC111688568 isoform X2 [Lucilia cuprina]|uniref:uncharacterized protein LOC111688568 isoform X2 n=1 Tax=Lucilia cuprina TaxID=7375 RepID=UPI001F061E00|nr:uncharacterized protein LOC111688568 isoform X2 [Lucilia cuprina]
MLPNPLPIKLTQISEQALAPQQVPLILGQDLFLLTQQDVRKIEDSRLFSLSKLMPNGDLKLINLQNPNDCLMHLLNGANQQFLKLLEFLNDKRNVNEHLTAMSFEQCYTSCPQPMEVSTTQCEQPVVASIEQQLQWNKCVNTSAPFPMTYSQGTSSTEINWQTLDDRKQENIHKPCCCCCRSKSLCNKKTNTQEQQQNECCSRSEEILGAREQLKRKKLNFNFNYLT